MFKFPVSQSARLRVVQKADSPGCTPPRAGMAGHVLE